jgi:Stress responsive A/B Barrel Domain.
MFRHVAMWEFEDDDDPVLNRENAIKIKAGLEELVYEVHGLIELDVHIDPAKTFTANADILMESVFDNREAYRAYLEHPRRKAIAELIDSCTGTFLCMDFEEEHDSEIL